MEMITTSEREYNSEQSLEIVLRPGEDAKMAMITTGGGSR